MFHNFKQIQYSCTQCNSKKPYKNNVIACKYTTSDLTGNGITISSDVTSCIYTSGHKVFGITRVEGKIPNALVQWSINSTPYWVMQSVKSLADLKVYCKISSAAEIPKQYLLQKILCYCSITRICTASLPVQV